MLSCHTGHFLPHSFSFLPCQLLSSQSFFPTNDCKRSHVLCTHYILPWALPQFSSRPDIIGLSNLFRCFLWMANSRLETMSSVWGLVSLLFHFTAALPSQNIFVWARSLLIDCLSSRLSFKSMFLRSSKHTIEISFVRLEKDHLYLLDIFVAVGKNSEMKCLRVSSLYESNCPMS